jgi:hypothetical protein
VEVLTFHSALDSLLGKNARRARHDCLAEECGYYEIEILWATRSKHIVAQSLVTRIVQAFQPACKVLALFFCQVIWGDTIVAALDQSSDERLRTDSNIGRRKTVTVHKYHGQEKYSPEFVIHWLMLACYSQQRDRLRS